MKEILLTRNKIALIDDEDFEKVSQFKWLCNASGYVVHHLPRKDGKRQALWMHRLILNAPKSMVVDHINHDTLDNRKENLRLCSRNENCHNRLKNKKSLSIYKGVCWQKRVGKWRGQIILAGKKKHIGYFTSEDIAAKAYNEAAIKNYGQFACINKEVSING